MAKRLMGLLPCGIILLNTFSFERFMDWPRGESAMMLDGMIKLVHARDHITRTMLTERWDALFLNSTAALEIIFDAMYRLADSTIRVQP